MTCIVALRAEGRVYMGADSAGVDSWSSIARADPKVFRNGRYLFGCTSSYRMIQILRHEKLETVTGSHDSQAYKLANQLQALFVRQQFAKVEHGVAEGGSLLVAWDDVFYQLDSDYQYARYREDYYSVGSGYMFALGALYANASLTPRKRIRQALSAAVHNSGGVKPPFKIMATEAV